MSIFIILKKIQYSEKKKKHNKKKSTEILRNHTNKRVRYFKYM